jgi:hypothetical protein
MKKITVLPLLSFLVLAFLEISYAAPPAKPAHTVWIEAETAKGPGLKKESGDNYGGGRYEVYGQASSKHEMYWDFIIPETGYYSLQLGAQSVSNFCSPYYWWIDTSDKQFFKGGKGREVNTYSESGFCWHVLTIDADEWVLLEKGPHRFYLETSESRNWEDEAVSLNLDAIFLKLQKK